MKKELAEHAKRLLEEEKTRLESELSKFNHRSKNSEKMFEDSKTSDKEREDESASDVAQFSDNLSLEEELDKALRDVDSALRQIESGEYGVCKYCHQPIDERRLLARPTSSSCIQCKKTLTQEM